MEIVETYRQRWWLVWWTAGLLVVAIPLASLIARTQVNVNGTTVGPSSALSGIVFPLSGLALVPMFLGMIFATGAGLSLNRESMTRALSWTKPASRTSIALRIFAVDVALIALLYVITWFVVLGCLAVGGIHAAPDALLGVSIALTLGVAVMWYALIEALTSGFGSGARGIIGGLWPAALFVQLATGEYGATLDAVVHAINFFNPLAYASSSSSSGHSGASYWQYPIEERALVVWILAVALGALATIIWKQREA
jgi:hypothetical protein